MERPNVRDFRKDGDVYNKTVSLGDYAKAGEAYSDFLKEGSLATEEFPDVYQFIDGTGLVRSFEYIRAIEQHVSRMEGRPTVQVYRKKVRRWI